MNGTIAIQERLTLMADAGATLRELVATLDRHRDVARNEYDNLWLYCWVLVKQRSSRLPPMNGGVGYGEVGPG
jgi:hypothetical protein